MQSQFSLYVMFIHGKIILSLQELAENRMFRCNKFISHNAFVGSQVFYVDFYRFSLVKIYFIIPIRSSLLRGFLLVGDCFSRMHNNKQLFQDSVVLITFLIPLCENRHVCCLSEAQTLLKKNPGERCAPS